MTKSTRRVTPLIILILITCVNAFSQTQKPAPSCSQQTFAVFKQLPKMEYQCPDGATDSDSKILKLPERLAAIRVAVRELEKFTNAAWWQADI